MAVRPSKQHGVKATETRCRCGVLFSILTSTDQSPVRVVTADYDATMPTEQPPQPNLGTTTISSTAAAALAWSPTAWLKSWLLVSPHASPFVVVMPQAAATARTHT